MRTIEVLIFDLDGTLVDSRADIARAVNVALRYEGRPEKSAEEIAGYIGPASEEMLRRLMGTATPAQITAAAERFQRYFQRHPAAASTLYPGVRRVLEHFQGKRLLVVSNRSTELAAATLTAFAIGSYFSRIVGADDAFCVKPTACPLERALEGSNADRSQTLMIGDMDSDIAAGRAAGICTCAVTYGYGSRDRLQRERPDFLVDHLEELTDIIG